MQKFKKYARKSFALMLTLGASATFGFLSFSGMLAITPILAIGITSFALAVLYEGEIYHSSILASFKRLFSRNYLKQELSNKLLKSFIENNKKHPHAFIKDYIALKEYCKAIHQEHATKAQQKALKRLKLMEAHFMRLVFANEETNGEYDTSLHTLIKAHPNFDSLDPHFKQLQFKIRIAKGFSIISGILFGFGNLYLLADGFAALSVLGISTAVLPYIIVPLSVLAGLAYIFLIFNSVSQMLETQSLSRWVKSIIQNICGKNGAKGVVKGLIGIFFIALGLSLTIFTAGTWWTIASKTPGLLPFLTRLPSAIAGIIVPLVTGLAQLIFNLENTKESIDTMDEYFEKNDAKAGRSDKALPIWQRALSAIRAFFSKLYHTATGYISGKCQKIAADFKKAKNTHAIKAAASKPQELQTLKAKKRSDLFYFFNPFHWLITILQAPIKILGFIGHVISAGVTGDQIPGVAPAISIGANVLSESFEDFHWFAPDAHDEHSHNFPALVYQFLLSPLYFLATLWNWLTNTHSFTDNWQHLWSHHDLDNPHTHADTKTIPTLSSQSSSAIIQSALTAEQTRLKDKSYHKKEALGTLKHACETKNLSQALRENTEAVTSLGKHRSLLFRCGKTRSIETLHTLEVLSEGHSITAM